MAVIQAFDLVMWHLETGALSHSFETKSYVNQASLKSNIYCLHFPSAGITAVFLHAQFIFYLLILFV